MVTAGREMQQDFGYAVPPAGGAGNQQSTDLFGPRRTAGLTGRQRIDAAAAEIAGEQADLGAFPGALAAFQGHEDALACHCPVVPSDTGAVLRWIRHDFSQGSRGDGIPPPDWPDTGPFRTP